MEIVQVCCWLAPHGRPIAARSIIPSISTDVVGEQIYNRLVLGHLAEIRLDVNLKLSHYKRKTLSAFKETLF